MTFNFIKLPELDFDLSAVTTETGRVYETPNGAKYPSVTTVLSEYNKKQIFEWRQRVGNDEANKIAGRASRRGTKLHSLCEEYLRGELTELKRTKLMPLDKMMFNQLKPFLDEKVDNIYCLEQSLYSDELRLAGRVDLIAEWEDEISVIDFKSSTKEKNEKNIENYFMQCSAYAEMFEERTGKSINKIVVAIATEEELPQIFVKEKYNYLQSLDGYIKKYWSDNNYG